VVGVGKLKVSWSIDSVVVERVASRSAAEGRSVSSAAERLLLAGLGGEEPHIAVGADGASSRGVGLSASGSSSPPSSEVLSERGAEPAGRDGEARGGQTPSGLPRSESALSHFKPDPKPGRKS